MSIRVSFQSELRPADVARLWRPLADRASPSFFLSWTWIGTWLEQAALRANLLVARRRDQVIGLALLLCPARRSWLPRLHLTASGDGEMDSVFVEYNGFLALPHEQTAVDAAFTAFLASRPLFGGKLAWTHLVLPGVSPSLAEFMAAARLPTRSLARKSCPFIDLAAIRRNNGDYLATRSRNCRYQIRRSERLLEAMGNLTLEPAADLNDALAILDELEKLHQRAWRQRGQPGAFASQFFRRFHRALLHQAWPKGEIDLLRLRAGGRTFGCLYNFIEGGRAYAYQSGFDFSLDARHKPGLLSHMLATNRYLALGLDRYLLLAGESRYKASLATDTETLEWLTVRHSRLLAAAEDVIRAVARLRQRAQV